MKSKFELLTIK